MKTVETKISKSGATIYYVDGKRTSRENAMFIQRMNDAEARRLAKIETEKAERENELATVTDEVNDSAEVKDDDSKLAELFQDREVKRRAALHSSFDSEESKAARDANKAVEEFIGKVAKDLRDKAPVGLSVVASWDSADLDAPKFVVIELATDKRTCYGKIAEVKAALTVTKTVTVKAENATHAVEILDKLNFRNVEFVYHGDTNEHGLPVVYRHFDGINADGNDTCFGLIEIVIDGKLDAVRFINNYREQFTDIKIGNAKYTLGDKGEINLIDEPETKTDTPEENVEKLFDAYEAQNSVAHISENGYIAAVNFQPQNTVRWHCKIRRYQNLDEAIDAVRYVNEHDTFTVTRGGRVETEYGKRNERTREYFARTLYGVEYFKEAYFDELVDQYAVTVDAFNFAVEYEIEEAEIAAAESRAIARILADDNLAARYYKAKTQVKCKRYENGYCGWYFKGKHSDDWEHDETKAAACLTRYGLSRFEFSVLSEDEKKCLTATPPV